MSRIINDPFTFHFPHLDIHGETSLTCIAVINSFIKDNKNRHGIVHCQISRKDQLDKLKELYRTFGDIEKLVENIDKKKTKYEKASASIWSAVTVIVRLCAGDGESSGGHRQVCRVRCQQRLHDDH